MPGRNAHAARPDPAEVRGPGDGSASLWGEGFSEAARNLLSSAVACFAAQGFHATTTRDISTGAGLSPAALYVHFASKEHVLFAIARRGHESALAAIEEPAAVERPDPAARLRAIVAAFVAWHARHHVAARVCQYELAALAPGHYEDIRELRRRFTVVFREAVLAGVAEGWFAEVDVDRVVRAMLSLGIDLVRWYRLDGEDSPERLGEFYADLGLRMIRAGGSPPG